MRLVRWLFGLAVAATLAWGGLWFLGARALDQAIATVLDGFDSPLRAREHVVRGFPNRFDITLTEPRLAQGGMSWAAPFVQVFALSYRPHHVILVLPPEQRLDLGGESALVTTQDARASLVMQPGARLALERLVLVAQGPGLLLGGERLAADALRAALRPAEGGFPASYDAVVEIEAAFPDAAVLDRIDPAGHLPRRYDLLRLDGLVRFDRPVDMDALNGAPPRLVEAALTGARASFDGIDLSAVGRVVADAWGRPAGEFTLAVTGWAALLDRLDAAGALPAETMAWVRLAAPGLTRPGAPQVIDIPLRFEAGQLRLGPFVLAELPGL